MSGPLLRVEVFPDGIVVQPAFMSPVAILKQEIGRVSRGRPFLGGATLRIDHSSPDTRPPLLLYTASDGELARAIERVAGTPVVDA